MDTRDVQKKKSKTRTLDRRSGLKRRKTKQINKTRPNHSKSVLSDLVYFLN